MKSTSTETKTEEIDVLEWLTDRNGWLKLPLAVMRSRDGRNRGAVGAAVQTLGGILKLTTTRTFVKYETIAEKAHLPPRTVRHHIAALTAEGWLINHHRERTPRGRCRRTVTLEITPQLAIVLKDKGYGVLPTWACRIGLTWSAKAVLSIVMGKLLSFKGASEKDGRFDTWDMIVNRIGESRFEFSISRLVRETGLSKQSVANGIDELNRAGIIAVTKFDKARGDDGQGLFPMEFVHA